MVCIALVCPPAQCLASDQLDTWLHRMFSSNELNPKLFGPARWIEQGAAYTTLEDKQIVKYDTASGQRSVLISASAITPKGSSGPIAIDDYVWSSDAKQLLLFTNTVKVWRDNTRGDYWVLNRSTGVLRKIGGSARPSTLMFAHFSPDGTKIAYVRENNVYVEDVVSGAIRALTTNGSVNIINGTSDWVYEEELSLRDCIRWSPDGKRIAYWQFDTSGVRQFTLVDNTSDLYPKVTLIPYPKVDTTNSSVRVGVVNLAGGSTRWISVPGDPRQNYLFRMEWAGNSDELVIGQLNRLQNHLSVYLAQAATGKAKVFFEDRDEAWVDVSVGGFEWTKNGKKLLWVSERDGWRHAYLAPRSGGEPKLVTTAKSDITSVAGLDPEGKWIWYTASPGNAAQNYLYRSDVATPITPSTQPGWHNYNISPDNQWAFHTWSSIDRPPLIELISLPDHKSIRVLEDNAALRLKSEDLLKASVEFLTVELSDGAQLDGWLIRPPGFDSTKKYPIIVYVYGEPASQTVVDRWQERDNGQNRHDKFNRALAMDGYLVVSLDNRGTPAPKGRAWRKSVYGSVGDLSAKDQTEALRVLVAQRPYIDTSRVGVWGWSGGGSNTLNLMFRFSDVYKVGVSVAPVPDQRLYDTIYQERYMGLPDQNEAGYRKGSPIHFAEGLKGRLLIVHGSGDDNVHIQGTERLLNRLIELGKPFDFMEYPNRSHSISEGSGTSLHIFSLIGRYFEEHLPLGAR